MEKPKKHITHRINCRDGNIEIHHFIAKNEFMISLFEESSTTTVELDMVNREQLRELRDTLTRILGS